MFIVLHDFYEREKLVNINKIRYFASYDENNSTTIVKFDAGNYIIVRETIKEIKNLIKESA